MGKDQYMGLICRRVKRSFLCIESGGPVCLDYDVEKLERDYLKLKSELKAAREDRHKAVDGLHKKCLEYDKLKAENERLKKELERQNDVPR